MDSHMEKREWEGKGGPGVRMRSSSANVPGTFLRASSKGQLRRQEIAFPYRSGRTAPAGVWASAREHGR